MQFVHSTGVSRQETKANKHLVRSHISKSNRRRTKALANEALRQRKVVDVPSNTPAVPTRPAHSPQTNSECTSPTVDSEDDIDCEVVERYTASTLRGLSPAMYLATLSAKSMAHDAPAESNESANYCTCHLQPFTSRK